MKRESSTRLPDDDRFLELLVDRATQWLELEERVELGEFLVDNPEVDDLGLELAAAAADRAFAAEHEEEPLPAALQERVLASWSNPPSEAPRAPSVLQLLPRTPAALSRLGAAAAILVALWLGYILSEKGRLNPPVSTPTELRDNLIVSAPDLVRWGWNGLGDPAFANVTGEVVWSNERQEGYMTLRNLPSNNPTESQYQLWIVDPERDKNPVDGGVFNVAAAEVVIPIDAKLPVIAPGGFALTLEKPGGVVVSAGPLLTLAGP